MPEDYVEEEERPRKAHPQAHRNGRYEESRYTAAAERSRGRPAPSRTSSYEQEQEIYEDQTEDGSDQEEGEGSVYSDAPAEEEDEEEEEEEEEEKEEDYPTDPLVIEELEKFQATFRGFEKRFRLINKIGEGTFSSVYKAEDLLYDRYDNSWDIDEVNTRRTGPRPPKYVAIKKIYVTSSPARIQNELELLHDLSGCRSVVPLITAFRHQDQVVAILPYFQHVDFREYFRSLTTNDMVAYFRSLFSALSHVHRHKIIHRDIKPTNFLYDYHKRRGVLCDFGLAEREGTDSSRCMCTYYANDRKERLPAIPTALTPGYPKNDSRPARRANRAGTRGFRAPEVLFKCTAQTTKIDIWSAGVILLTILSKRFPFFNSSDDVDAVIEIATIFGKTRMRNCAALHGCVFDTTIPTIGDKGFTLEKIILWATNRTSGTKDDVPVVLSRGEQLAIQFLQRCFDLDPFRRISADEALRHPFLRYCEDSEEEDPDLSMGLPV
ncbi:kinase-like domain-containing protein [Sphaerosporella brunnea]|uniref:non-specific serine/threonine protein kinase n=1 Tax=Sphaerosporella brunnea TaxID=1250544 RepID=A0A5J5EPE7_9PEZI|nr:kinase-like domain-containing protein [Sphaerosporella brunnea]